MESAATTRATTPDLSGLAAWPVWQWRDFGDRLKQIGVNEANLGPIATVLPGALPRLSMPMQRWWLRQNNCDFNYAARLLVFADSVAREQAESAFGAELLEAMIASGMLALQQDGTVLSRFRLNLAKGQYILADDLRWGADAVMGAGPTTLGLIEAVDGENLGRVLDLGCGAGAMALALAKGAESVIATDINPRALLFGRINAAMNGVAKVEFREGDLYEPVEPETFDLIVSQPPFIPRPDGSAPAAYLFGGTRGDELPLRVMAATAEHLRDGGRAAVLIQWPVGEGESLSRRVRNAVSASDVDVLLVTFPPLDLNHFCLVYAGHDQAELGKQFEKEVIRWREHFARMRITSMQHCFNLLRKRSKQRAWTRVVFPATGIPTRESIDKLFARYDLLSAEEGTLLSAQLRLRHDAILLTEERLANDGEQKLRICFAGPQMNRPAEVNPEMTALLRAVHTAGSVRSGIHAYCGRVRDADALAAVKEALELGLLEVADRNG